MKALNTLVAKHPDKIKDWYKDLDGYWINLKCGWSRDGVHTVHEWNVRDALAGFKEVTPCDCRECRTKGAEWDYYDIDTGTIKVGRKEKG